jgi:hypothetical protein
MRIDLDNLQHFVDVQIEAFLGPKAPAARNLGRGSAPASSFEHRPYVPAPRGSTSTNAFQQAASGASPVCHSSMR